MHALEHSLLMVAAGLRHKARTQHQREELADYLVELASRSHTYVPTPFMYPDPGGPLSDDEALIPLAEKLSRRYRRYNFHRAEE